MRNIEQELVHSTVTLGAHGLTLQPVTYDWEAADG